MAAMTLFALALALVSPAVALTPAVAHAQDAGAGSQDQGAHDQNGGGNGTDGGFLRRDDFNVFGRANQELLNTQFGSWLARLMARFMVIAFDASLVIGIGLLFAKLVMVLIGKATRESVMGRLTDMAIAIIGVVLILTGGLSLVINYLIRGASEIQREVSVRPAATVVAVVDQRPGGVNG